MNTIENRIVDSVKRKFSAPLLPFVESISLAKSPAQKIIVKYFWEDYVLFFITAILSLLLTRFLLFLYPSNRIADILSFTAVVIFTILDGYWPTRFSFRFTNKTGYGFSAFYSLPLKSEQLINQLFITHFILSGFLFLTIVSFFIGYLDIKSVYCLLSIKLIALLIFAGMVTYQELRWFIFSFGLILSGLTFYGYFYPGKIIYQLPLTLIFAVAIYFALVFSFHENRASHKKAPPKATISFRDFLIMFGSILLSLTLIYSDVGRIIHQSPLTALFVIFICVALVPNLDKYKVNHKETSRIDVNNEKDLRSSDDLNSRKSKTDYSLFKKGYSSDVMLSLLFLQSSDLSVIGILFYFAVLSLIIWFWLPHYLLFIPILFGVITMLLAWIGRQTSSNTEYSENYISILPVSSEKWGNHFSLAKMLLYSLILFSILPLFAKYNLIYLLVLVWIYALRMSIPKYLKLLNGTLRIFDWIGYILIPCGALTLYFGEMIPSFMKAILIIILLSLSLGLLSLKAIILHMMGKGFGVLSKKSQSLFFITVFIQSLLVFILLSSYLSANVLCGILQLPISFISALLINLCLAVSWGISQSLIVFVEPMCIYLGRHQ